jgi:glycine cleavage system regulatory protein
MITSLVLTVIGPDKPGLVSAISDRATAFGANWLESRMANLSGQFAGIVHLHVPPANADPLIAALRELESQGLSVTISKSRGGRADSSSRLLKLELVGQDRPGIVRDISRALAVRGVSIDELATECVSGSWSGENLFQAKAQLRVPAAVATEELRRILERLANELMVDLSLEEAPAA